MVPQMPVKWQQNLWKKDCQKASFWDTNSSNAIKIARLVEKCKSQEWPEYGWRTQMEQNGPQYLLHGLLDGLAWTCCPVHRKGRRAQVLSGKGARTKRMQHQEKHNTKETQHQKNTTPREHNTKETQHQENTTPRITTTPKEHNAKGTPHQENTTPRGTQHQENATPRECNTKRTQHQENITQENATPREHNSERTERLTDRVHNTKRTQHQERTHNTKRTHVSLTLWGQMLPLSGHCFCFNVTQSNAFPGRCSRA